MSTRRVVTIPDALPKLDYLTEDLKKNCYRVVGYELTASDSKSIARLYLDGADSLTELYGLPVTIGPQTAIKIAI